MAAWDGESTVVLVLDVTLDGTARGRNVSALPSAQVLRAAKIFADHGLAGTWAVHGRHGWDVAEQLLAIHPRAEIALSLSPEQGAPPCPNAFHREIEHAGAIGCPLRTVVLQGDAHAPAVEDLARRGIVCVCGNVRRRRAEPELLRGAVWSLPVSLRLAPSGAFWWTRLDAHWRQTVRRAARLNRWCLARVPVGPRLAPSSYEGLISVLASHAAASGGTIQTCDEFARRQQLRTQSRPCRSILRAA